ncbi:hypothetical protein DFR50_12426 [Roseiarcus fermentans]|uniref:Uncharacterized protein n=1 Tax=Roseiarcus fermentans TaxID=1473586 RepID=A0A366F3T0_9HYPH|nr:hypothetical protein [Roseiarcus fermentans]RBP08640.1 hypothetical protein DFR50_12426 [Roseiarcus fermentans]
MLRTILLVGLAVMALAAPKPSQAADTVYDCVPDEPRVTAPDRLVSVEIRLKPNGAFASVVYRAANGAVIDRAAQYQNMNGQEGNFRYWVGRLRNNPNVGIMGSFQRNQGRLFYLETVHDNLQGGRTVAQVTSLCDGGRLDYGEVASSPPQSAPPPPIQAPQPSPSPTLPDPEIKKFLDCVDAATVALAAISNEPAQTVVDAAKGECPKEEVALESALERHGIAKSVDWLDGLMKEMRPNLLALVLNARASAARPSEGPAKTEPTKGQAL